MQLAKEADASSDDEGNYKPDADEDDERFGKAPGHGRHREVCRVGGNSNAWGRTKIGTSWRARSTSQCSSRCSTPGTTRSTSTSTSRACVSHSFKHVPVIILDFLCEPHVQGRNWNDLPDQVQAGERKGMYDSGKGVFITQHAQPKDIDEMNLHRTAALLLRNLPPGVTRAELLSVSHWLIDCFIDWQLCGEVHGGFLRLRVLPPDPNQRWYRNAIATFWHNANLTKITWKVRGTVMRGAPLQVCTI